MASRPGQKTVVKYSVYTLSKTAGTHGGLPLKLIKYKGNPSCNMASRPGQKTVIKYNVYTLCFTAGTVVKYGGLFNFFIIKFQVLEAVTFMKLAKVLP